MVSTTSVSPRAVPCRERARACAYLGRNELNGILNLAAPKPDAFSHAFHKPRLVPRVTVGP
jgi:hypothetical protein